MSLIDVVVRAPFALIDGDLRPAAVAVCGDLIVDIAGFNDEFDAEHDITLPDCEVLVLADAGDTAHARPGRGIRVGVRADLIAWGGHDVEAATVRPMPARDFLPVPAT
ncbi:hypothetical protein [Demequina globuliformis]|uniref:hypothetical protein n=1 Tax=Demequina globuliformis TaxID=676202 RepID=UPI000783A3D2|nr:hypothetical protein [Demequina globuliformis]